jgi:sugar phosphate isomerase/epimerase
MTEPPNSKFEIQNSKLIAYPSLAASYKKAFPFKIACPSYIHPDHIIPNVRALGPFVDEIELILFESHPESLPTEKEIDILETLAEDLNITYNIHLPLDLNPGSNEKAERRKATEILKSIFTLTAPLKPTTHTLHLVYEGSADENNYRKKWTSHLFESLEGIMAAGLKGRSISIETLSYPLNWIDDLFEAFDLSVCIDVGHLLLSGISLSETFKRYEDRLTIVHLHGVEDKKDHQAVDRLSDSAWNLLLEVMGRFYGVVSIEVFSFDRLAESLHVFDNRWKRFKHE